jgi:hypothetical protein
MFQNRRTDSTLSVTQNYDISTSIPSQYADGFLSQELLIGDFTSEGEVL